MPSNAELLNRILDVFNERDAAKRSAAIGEIFAADLVFVDPDGETRGLPDFTAKVSALVDGSPETFRFTGVEPPQGVGDLGMHRWKLGPDGAEPVAGGVDVILVDGDRISRLWTVLD